MRCRMSDSGGPVKTDGALHARDDTTPPLPVLLGNDLGSGYYVVRAKEEQEVLNGAGGRDGLCTAN